MEKGRTGSAYSPGLSFSALAGFVLPMPLPFLKVLLTKRDDMACILKAKCRRLASEGTNNGFMGSRRREGMERRMVNYPFGDWCDTARPLSLSGPPFARRRLLSRLEGDAL